VFLVSAIPAALNIVNFMTYPKYLDGDRLRHTNGRAVVTALVNGLRSSFGDSRLRRLLIESMSFEGVFKISKDYLQPVLRYAALSLPVLLWASDKQRTAVLAGAVYFVLYMVSSFASRKADTVSRRAGGEERGARWVWGAVLVAFVLLTAALWLRLLPIAIAAFAGLYVLQNIWRPMLIARVADKAQPEQMATVLSVESQAKALFAAVVAPLLGLAVDLMPNELRFVPVGVLGIAVAAIATAASAKTMMLPTTSDR